MAQKWGPIVIGLIVVAVLTGVAYRYRLLPGDDPAVDGNMGVALHVTYMDGSTRTIAPETPLSAVGLKITGLIGGPIADLEPRIKYRVNWDGDLIDWEMSGYLRLYMDGTVFKDLKIAEDGSTHTLRKGFYKDLASVSYSATQLENLAQTAGRHELKVVGYLIVSITFADGTVDAKKASHEIVFKFDYEPDAPEALSMITEFSVQTYAYPTFE
jgi:hypothetical protein